MTAQLQYRRNDNEQRNVLPLLGGHTSSSSIAVPVSFNIRHKRTMHAISVNFSSTSATTTNHYAGVEDVAGQAGIAGVSTDPFNWGVPSLSFSSLSSLRDVTPSRRDRSTAGGVVQLDAPYKPHQLRAAATSGSIAPRSQIRSQRCRRVRLHRALHVRRRPTVRDRRPRLRRLPPRAAAAGHGPVRPRQRADDAASR